MKSFKKAFMLLGMGILPECTSVRDAHAVPVEGEEGTGPLDMEGGTDKRGQQSGAEN